MKEKAQSVASATNTETVASEAVTVKAVTPTLKLLNTMIDTVLLGAKTLIQSSDQWQKQLHDAVYGCVLHAHDHGDCMPALRLLEGLPNHEVIRGFRGEIMSYIRSVSPISFYIGKDGANRVRLLKDGEPGYRAFDLEEAQKPFYERETVKKAREAAFQAASKTLQPLTLKDIRSRIFGVRRTFESAFEKDKNGNIRGVAEGEQAAIKRVLASVEDAFRDAAGKKGEALEPKKEAA